MWFFPTWPRSLVKVKVAQSCPTLCKPLDCTVHGILQARILEWVALPFSRGSSQPRDRTQVSRIAGGFFTSCNSTQFWHCLPRDRVRSHRLRDQSHKTASVICNFRCKLQILVVICASDYWLNTGCRFKVLMTLPLGLINLLEHRPQRNTLLPRLLVYYKRT